jgi:serine/threonine protein kinase
MMTTPPPPQGSSQTKRPNPDSQLPDQVQSADSTASRERSAAEVPVDSTPTVITTKRQPSVTESGLTEKLAGRRLGHFELLEAVGVGGMAAVIRAKDLHLGRIVALKILPPDMAVDPENIKRFKHEARAAAKLDHENIARVYFCGEDAGLHFIAFEFVEGENLRTKLEKQGGPLPVPDCVNYMLQIAAGLAHAASRGVIHRDIKPSNIVITHSGQAKIVDMGLARSLDAAVAGTVTQSGVTLGTFDYISPEQALEPRSADVRSDIYSLGCTFYHLLTGVPPVPEGTAAKKLHWHQHVQPIDPRQHNPDLPDELAAILAKMMLKSPRARYQTPEELIRDLQRLAQKLHDHNGLISARAGTWPNWASVSVAVVMLACVIGLAVSASDPTAEVNVPWLAAEPARPSEPATLAPIVPNLVKPPAKSADDPSAPVRTANAATPAELARLLQEKVGRIRLTGRVYDFGPLEATSPLVFEGSSLILEANANEPVVFKWRQNETESGERVPLLRLAGNSRPLRGQLVGIRFVGVGPTGSAVRLSDCAQFELRHCEFVLQSGSDPTVTMHQPREPGRVTMQDCGFLQGNTALHCTGPLDVELTNCLIGPHARAVGLSKGKFSVALNRSTVLLESGIVLDLSERARADVLAKHNLFARAPSPAMGPRLGEVMLIRQDETSRAEFRGVPGQPNAYYQIGTFWRRLLEREGVELVMDVQGLHKQDANPEELAVLLPTDRNPFRSDDPLGLLPKSPLEAAALKADLLRPRLGKQLPGIVSYAGVPIDRAGRVEPISTQTKLVMPEASPDELGPGKYRSLREAIAESKPGDVIEIDSDEEIILGPIQLDRQTNLVIRPHAARRPTLVFSSNRPEDRQELFLLYHGQLTLEQLAFRLRLDDPRRENVALVRIKGDGQLLLRDCTITLPEDNQAPPDEPTTPRILCAIALDEPSKAMDMDKRAGPQVQVQRVFVRGRGDFINSQTSRQFSLDLANLLAVLDGSLVTLEASPKAAGVENRLNLARITTSLTEPLLVVRGSGGERKGLVLDVVANDNLYLAGSKHLVVLRGNEKLSEVLRWRSVNCVYDESFMQLVDLRTENQLMMPADSYGPQSWLLFTGQPEQPYPFQAVRLKGQPGKMARSEARLNDFRVTLDNWKQDQPGAILDQLPSNPEPPADELSE